MADAVVKAGMRRDLAYEMVAQAVLGSAKLFLESEAVLGEKMHPGQLKDMVCSPGGTTIEGVKALEEGGFRGVLMEAVEATIAKSKLL
jgi:pyrroline-5-carboxylate reductase